MANFVPLNTFLSVTGSLTTTPQELYTTTASVSTILLSVGVANVSLNTQYFGMHMTKSGSATPIYIVSGSGVAKGETINPLPGKIIVQKGDGIWATGASNNNLHVILSVLETAID
jgi:hypothetical protein